jgi:hypothetical protein
LGDDIDVIERVSAASFVNLDQHPQNSEIQTMQPGEAFEDTASRQSMKLSHSKPRSKVSYFVNSTDGFLAIRSFG